MISHATAQSYHTLLAEAEELLHFLRHEHLGTANCISDKLKNWEANGTYVFLEIWEQLIVQLIHP